MTYTSPILWVDPVRPDGFDMLWLSRDGSGDHRLWGTPLPVANDCTSHDIGDSAPLVICYITMENHHRFKVIFPMKSIVIFHSCVTNYQRVYISPLFFIHIPMISPSRLKPQHVVPFNSPEGVASWIPNGCHSQDVPEKNSSVCRFTTPQST